MKDWLADLPIALKKGLNWYLFVSYLGSKVSPVVQSSNPVQWSSPVNRYTPRYTPRLAMWRFKESPKKGSFSEAITGAVIAFVKTLSTQDTPSSSTQMPCQPYLVEYLQPVSLSWAVLTFPSYASYKNYMKMEFWVRKNFKSKRCLHWTTFVVWTSDNTNFNDIMYI